MGTDFLGMSEITSQANGLTQSARSIGTAANATSNIVGTVTNLIPGAGLVSGLFGGGSSGTTTSAAATNSGPVVPKGTCIVIPANMSMTNKTRYLGENTYKGLSNMITGAGTDNISDVLVVGPDNKPSPLVYDVLPTGGLVLKGTQTPVNLNVNSDGSYNATIINEKEFASIKEGMKRQGAGQFSATGDGNVEDCDNRSWWSRNKEWLITALTTLLGAVGAFFLFRKEKKATKKANADKTAAEQKTAELLANADKNNQNNNSNGNNSNSGNGGDSNSGGANNNGNGGDNNNGGANNNGNGGDNNNGAATGDQYLNTQHPQVEGSSLVLAANSTRVGEDMSLLGTTGGKSYGS